MAVYYTITVNCIHCRCPCPWAVVAEEELPPDTKITIYCPSHGGPIPVRLHYFKKVGALPPGMTAHPYPPSPQPPPSPPLPTRPLWWQFWKW